MSELTGLIAYLQSVQDRYPDDASVVLLSEDNGEYKVITTVTEMGLGHELLPDDVRSIVPAHKDGSVYCFVFHTHPIPVTR